MKFSLVVRLAELREGRRENKASFILNFMITVDFTIVRIRRINSNSLITQAYFIIFTNITSNS